MRLCAARSAPQWLLIQIFRRCALEKISRHRRAAADCDAVRHRRGRAKHPLPAGLPLDTRRCLIGNHWRGAHLRFDAPGFHDERFGGARKHIGDGAFTDFKAEQTLQHLNQAIEERLTMWRVCR